MMRNQAKIFLVSLFLGLVVANFASAAFVNCARNEDKPKLPSNPSQQQISEYNAALEKWQCQPGDIFITIRTIINFLLSWAWLVCIIFIVWAGWSMVTAGGNEEAIATAKTTLSNAVIGFFLIMIAFVLLNFVVAALTGSKSDINDIFKLIP